MGTEETGGINDQKVTAAELAAYLRKLADQVERCGLREYETHLGWQRGLEEGEPVADGEGRLWATWEDDGTRRIKLRYRLLNVDAGKGGDDELETWH